VRIGSGAGQEDVKLQGAATSRLAAGTLTLATALTKAHAAGEPVVEIASASPTAAPSSPSGLPKTGGGFAVTDSGTLVLLLALGAALIVAAGGSLIAARASRRD
jgi:hypothetical protein